MNAVSYIYIKQREKQKYSLILEKKTQQDNNTVEYHQL